MKPRWNTVKNHGPAPDGGGVVAPGPGPFGGPQQQTDTISGRDPRSVLDRFFPIRTTATYPVLTSVRHNRALAKENRLGLVVRIDTISTESEDDAYLYVFVETSGDGRRWIQRSNQENSFAPEDADIVLPIPATDEVVPVLMRTWTDACEGRSRAGVEAAGPLLAFARLRLFFSSPEVAAHVKVYAQGRGHNREDHP